jgi:hypothetical protein
MLSSLRRTCGTVAAKVTGSRARRPRRRRLELEALEGRQLLSLGNEVLVNTTTRNHQLHSDNASAANGLSVVVWEDGYSSTDHDIRAQMYNADGSKRGSEIVVENSAWYDSDPSVAIDATGNFVVAWSQQKSQQNMSTTDVVARRFDSTGAPRGGTFTITASPDPSSWKGTHPDVASDPDGNFVVAYTHTDFFTLDTDVYAQRYNSNATLLQTIPVATHLGQGENSPSVAVSRNGRFDIGYATSAGNVNLNRYSSVGGLLGQGVVAVGSAPSVAMDDGGNAVVAYQRLIGSNYDIKATRVNSTGGLSAEIDVRSSHGSDQSPSVALSRTGGAFVVAYSTTDPLGIPGNRTVEVAEINSADTVVALHNLPGHSDNLEAALSIDADGDFLLSYSGRIGSDFNIFARRGHLLG